MPLAALRALGKIVNLAARAMSSAKSESHKVAAGELDFLFVVRFHGFTLYPSLGIARGIFGFLLDTRRPDGGTRRFSEPEASFGFSDTTWAINP
jgi:hypothetical protein